MHFNIQIFVSLSKIYYLCRHKEQHIWGCVGLIGILIKLFQKTEIVSFVNGGPYKSLLKGAKLQSRWITKTENTQIFFSSEFHHIIEQPLSNRGRKHFPCLFICIRKEYNMFSGIIEEMATVVGIEHDKENIHFTLECSFTNELKIDQSVAHNGVCLTVVELDGNRYTVTAMKETIIRSNLGLWNVGDKVNVERSMQMNGRLDGHIVQGHVDTTAICSAIEDANGSTYFTFSYEFDKEQASRGYFTVDKGSVTVNGVSLTVVSPTRDSFKVAIIPYTKEHTNFCAIELGSVVNLEFDIIGKYIARMNSLA